MALRSIGRLFYGALSLSRRMADEKDFPEPTPWTYGCIKQRRREAVILIQMVSSWRLARRGVSHISRFHDATNAFLSVTQEEAVRCTEPPFTRNEKDHCLVKQRIERSTLVVKANDPEVERG